MTLIYRPNDVMKRFNLKESVYKKYITALEKEGYVFQRNQQGHRIFLEKDIATLESFLELIKYDGMTIDKVAKKIGEKNRHNVTMNGMNEQSREGYDVMTLVNNAVSVALEVQEKQMTEKFKEIIQESVQTAIQKENEAMLKVFETKLNNAVEMQSRVTMKAIRDQQEETRKQIASMEEKKNRWKKIFSIFSRN